MERLKIIKKIFKHNYMYGVFSVLLFFALLFFSLAYLTTSDLFSSLLFAQFGLFIGVFIGFLGVSNDWWGD